MLAKAGIVLFDKTGTLTAGKPRLAGIVPAEGIDSNLLLVLAASAERASEHPLARAIMDAAMELGVKLLDASDFKSSAGMGVEAIVDGRRLSIGKRKFFDDTIIETEPGLEAKAEKFASDGMTTVFVASDGKIIGLIAITDSIKEGAARTVEKLKRMGLETAMVTGDNEAAAQCLLERTRDQLRQFQHSRRALRGYKRVSPVEARFFDGVR